MHLSGWFDTGSFDTGVTGGKNRGFDIEHVYRCLERVSFRSDSVFPKTIENSEDEDSEGVATESEESEDDSETYYSESDSDNETYSVVDTYSDSVVDTYSENET